MLFERDIYIACHTVFVSRWKCINSVSGNTTARIKNICKNHMTAKPPLSLSPQWVSVERISEMCAPCRKMSKSHPLCADLGTGIKPLRGLNQPFLWVAFQICKMCNLYSHSLLQILYQEADEHTGLLRNLQIVLQKKTCTCKSVLKYRAFQKEQTDF